jgi:lipoprotein signal peptidase
MVVTWDAVYKIADLLISAGIFVCTVIQIIPKRRSKCHRHKKKK